MDRAKLSLMARQIGRVNRRLFLQLFVNRLIICWSAALLLAVVWFLLQPFLVEHAAPWLRWTVAGGLAGIATLVTGLLAALAAPSRVLAALELDERFDLKERVTTSLMLTEEQLTSPAGQALLNDVEQRVGALNVAERFPIQLSWLAALVPTAAMALTLVALFYEPAQTVAKGDLRDELKQAPVNKVEIDKKFKQLKKRDRELLPNEPPPAEEIKRIDAELEKIANRPRETRDQLRQRMAEMQQLEDHVKDRQKQMMDRARSLQNRLQQLDQQAQKSKDAPANDLEKALADGDMNKAQQELDKLTDKLKNNELTDKEKDKLKDQLKDLQEKLERAANNKDKEEELKKLAREGKIDKETLQREMDRLEKDRDKAKDLSDLAQQLGAAKDSLEKGDSEGASEKLRDAAGKLKEMDLNDRELQDLQDQLDRLREAKKAAAKGDKGDKEGDGEGDGDGDKEGNGKGGKGDRAGKKGNGKGDSDEPNEGGVGEGRRPLGKGVEYKPFDARQRTDFIKEGKKIHDGFAPGKNYKAKSSPEMAGEVKRAAQEMSEAIEAQKIPKAARDIVKGYSDRLRDAQEGKAPAQPDKK